jgi:hypothetical protein
MRERLALTSIGSERAALATPETGDPNKRVNELIQPVCAKTS